MTSITTPLNIQDNFKLKENKALNFYNHLTKEQARKVTQIVTVNQKLIKTQAGKKIKVAGISMYPAFKGSCSNAGTCKKTCIAFTGRQTMSGNDNFELSIIDKAQLKRLWLYKNDNAYFVRRAKSEIEILSDFGEYKVFLREINSEILDMRIFKTNSVTTYNYFKDSKKIFKPVSDLQIYSWSELSNESHILACFEQNIPVSIVVPKGQIFDFFLNQLNHKMIKVHNGDNSDLASHDNFEAGKLNVHLLSEKRARFARQIGRTKFLESYKTFFQNLSVLSEI